MKFLKCKICLGEVDILGSERSVNKKTRCRKCVHATESETKSAPEVVIIRKRPLQ